MKKVKFGLVLILLSAFILLLSNPACASVTDNQGALFVELQTYYDYTPEYELVKSLTVTRGSVTKVYEDNFIYPNGLTFEQAMGYLLYHYAGQVQADFGIDLGAMKVTYQDFNSGTGLETLNIKFIHGLGEGL